MDDVDAVVIGSGPNGLVAAALLARAGWRVTVLERSAVAGGAVHSGALSVPGYVHDTYSAFYGLLHSSPVLHELGLDRAVEWAHFSVPVAAAVSPDHVATVHADVARTAEGLARRAPADGAAWRELYGWWQGVGTAFLRQMLGPVGAPGPGLAFARRARRRGLFDTTQLMLAPMEALATGRFTDPAARALLAAGASHADVAVDSPGSVPAALILAMAAQQVGMPVPVGGAGRLAAALVGAVEEAGGVVRCGAEVSKVVVERNRATGVETRDGGLVRARRAVLADTGPGALFTGLVGADALPARYLDGVRRFRYGTGVFKIDLALDGPAPWSAPELAACGVVHLTGDLDDMARAAYEARHGIVPGRPMLIVGQQSVADPSRAPAGGHTLWIETHVPPVPRSSGSWAAARDAFLDVVLARLEDHAPGLGPRVVGTAVRTPEDLEHENPNLVGGDLGAGSSALDQQLVFRPVPGWFRYATPVKGLYLCSASAHPGGGVHGMVGRNCAHRVLSDRRRRRI
ncbi:MAG TPA: NAD(P)/FAD-dependent oxidoreductase [Acidimicrobiales bacterium]|nr:NAD(P)/FAD-dependent oxidoreductase [Acidimicrobiales bacterium]